MSDRLRIANADPAAVRGSRESWTRCPAWPLSTCQVLKFYAEIGRALAMASELAIVKYRSGPLHCHWEDERPTLDALEGLYEQLQKVSRMTER